MAGNTKLLTVLKHPGSGHVGERIMHLHLISDGTQETNYVVFDNNDSTYGINNVLAGTIMDIRGGGKCSGTIRLAWDQGTDFNALSWNMQGENYRCFRDFGGIKNPGASGATGDVLLTSIGLASGDEFDLIITVKA